MTENTLYITGAGVSAESGIPTFRGTDGLWTVGSQNYTPQEMATRQMYLSHPDEFLLWYFKRFASYRHIKPNTVHHWLADKQLVTQNIDGLDGKAGNTGYIPIHGRLDKVTVLHEQGLDVPLIDAPWEDVAVACDDMDDETRLTPVLLDAFKISKTTLTPEPDVSLKPFVLLFDEYYTDLYRMSEAEHLMQEAQRVVFMGTSFSVNITSIALRTAISNQALIEVVDPQPIDLGYGRVEYHEMTAADYVLERSE
ncbi:MAG TPA: sirtuin [Rhodobacteraceae bacterium]|nr:sirtuin [Alphaproteobacteria bacterium]MCH9832421.1 sirtuin [Alphaproteobacteria bacterium]HAB37425.1 sirtuin [Paracoccaceae bacterium]